MDDLVFSFRLPHVDEDLKRSYDNLVKDQYIEGGQRYRRFAQFRLTKTAPHGMKIELLPHRPYIQGVNYNKMFGGIKREFAPIDVSIAPVLDYVSQLVPIDVGEPYLLRVHQFRTIVNRKTAGVCVPEGPHRDGVDFAAMICIGRSGVTGGVSQVMHTENGDPFFTHELQPGEGIAIRDKRVFHNATDIRLQDGVESGYRDLLLWGYIPWREDRYGSLHEDQLASGAVIEYA